MPPYGATPRPIPAGLLRVIRYSMLAMLLLFTGLVTYLHHENPPQNTATDLAAIRMVGFGLCAFALVANLVLRNVRQRAEPEKRGTFALIGSAFGEGSAMMGAVYYFLGGGLDVFSLGLVIFLASWALLPAEPDAA